MPREQINFPKPDSLIIDRFGHEIENESDVDVPDSAAVLTDPELHVSWSPESIGGHVQVSLNMEAEFLKRNAADLEGVSHRALYTPSLSRKEINKLIRVLRLARDKAYGRDE